MHHARAEQRGGRGGPGELARDGALAGEAPELERRERHHEGAEGAAQQLARGALEDGEPDREAEPHPGQDAREQQAPVHVGAPAQREPAAQDQAERHEHGQQLAERIEMDAERERDHRGAEARGGFRSEGEHDDAGEGPEPGINYVQENFSPSVSSDTDQSRLAASGSSAQASAPSEPGGGVVPETWQSSR